MSRSASGASVVAHPARSATKAIDVLEAIEVSRVVDEDFPPRCCVRRPHGKLVEKVDSTFLLLTDFSPKLP